MDRRHEPAALSAISFRRRFKWAGLGPEFIADAISHTNNTRLMAFEFTSFPRHEPLLAFELSAMALKPATPNERVHVANFRVKNPALRAKAAPPFKPWPRTATIHGEQFTLLAINTGLHATGRVSEVHLTKDWTEVLFQIGTNEFAQRSADPRDIGRDMGDWQIKSIELSDADGNIVRSGESVPRSGQILGRIIPLPDRSFMSRTDDGIGLVRGAIWPNQTWNVRTKLERSRTASLDAAHYWSTSIPVPAAGQRIPLEKSETREGCEIQLQAIERDGPSPPILISRFTAKDAASEWRLIDVKDQRGTNVVRRYRGGKADQRMELQASDQATNLQLTFALLHELVVELSGEPHILRTNVARWAKGSPHSQE
jgi:hypothetical protein